MYPVIFKKEGFPRISVFEDKIEIESCITGKIFSFWYKDIVDVKLVTSRDSFLYKVSGSHRMFVDILDNVFKREYQTLFIVRQKNKMEWDFEIPNDDDNDLLLLIAQVKKLIKIH